MQVETDCEAQGQCKPAELDFVPIDSDPDVSHKDSIPPLRQRQRKRNAIPRPIFSNYKELNVTACNKMSRREYDDHGMKALQEAQAQCAKKYCEDWANCTLYCPSFTKLPLLPVLHHMDDMLRPYQKAGITDYCIARMHQQCQITSGPHHKGSGYQTKLASSIGSSHGDVSFTAADDLTISQGFSSSETDSIQETHTKETSFGFELGVQFPFDNLTGSIGLKFQKSWINSLMNSTAYMIGQSTDRAVHRSEGITFSAKPETQSYATFTASYNCYNPLYKCGNISVGGAAGDGPTMCYTIRTKTVFEKDRYAVMGPAGVYDVVYYH